MKCNVKELALMSDAPCDIEGRLNYKKTTNGAIRESVFKERWFRLVKNYLFYFKLSEMGKFDTRSPAGVFVLENSSVQMEHAQAIPFAFSLSFMDEPEKRHVLAARTQDTAVQWVMKLRSSSYEALRSKLHQLQSQIFAISGSDPLLLVPRNEGAKLWAPSVPFSTAPACSSTSAGFSCHLHTNGHHFTLDRSLSDRHISRHRTEATTHSTRNLTESHNHGGDTWNQSVSFVSESSSVTKEVKRNFALEKSVTTPTLQHRFTPFDSSMFDAEPLYTRPAPSPPVRKKNSPRLNRHVQSESPTLAQMSRSLATTSILDPGPSIPPRRKISPKYLEINPSDGASGVAGPKEIEDLIKF